jgi:hypothetical protein
MALPVLALSFASCRSIRQAESIRTRDSTAVSEKLSVTPLTVPQSSVNLSLEIARLRDLPKGAVYTAHSGQATVTAGIEGDTIFITATCDSLQRLVYTYEKEIKRLSEVQSERQEEVKPATPPLTWFIYGLLSGIIITVIITIYFKKK